LDPNLPEAFQNLGMALADRGQVEEAATILSQAEVLLKKRQADHPRLSASRRALALIHTRMGTLRKRQGQFGQAESEFQKARPLLEQLASNPGADAGLIQDLALALNEAGIFYFDLKRFEEAQPLYERATRRRETGRGKPHCGCLCGRARR
jgi:tetratricopeptide (TPR) repeat protein